MEETRDPWCLQQQLASSLNVTAAGHVLILVDLLLVLPVSPALPQDVFLRSMPAWHISHSKYMLACCSEQRWGQLWM